MTTKDKDMSEQELFEEWYATDGKDFGCESTKGRDSRVWKAARAPLLARIAELELTTKQMREAMILFRERAEAYGEAWAKCHVAEYEKIPGSPEERFLFLRGEQNKLKVFAEAIANNAFTPNLDAYVSGKIAELDAKLEAAEKDAARIDYINRECLTVGTHSTGEDSYGWCIQQWHMRMELPVTLAKCYSEDVREAIDAAIRGNE